MNRLTYNDIATEYKKHYDYNFLAFAVTPWHAHGIDSAIKMLCDNGVKLKGIIVIYPHALSGILLDENNFIYKNKGNFKFAILEFQREKVLLKSLIEQIKYLYSKTDEDSRKLYFVKAWRPNCQLSGKIYSKLKGIRIHHIIVDEGLATYLNTWKSNLKMSNINIVSIMRAGKRLLTYIQQDILFNGMIRKKHDYTQMTVLIKKGSVLEKNSFAIKYYKEIIKAHAKDIDIETVEPMKNKVVICTQPYFDAGDVRNDADLDIYKLLCDQCRRKGIEIVIKPHPREKSIERLKNSGMGVIDVGMYSQESILAALGDNKPVALIGFNSTALINAVLFFDIPVMSVVKLIDLNMFDYHTIYDMKLFAKTFGNYVVMPEDEAECSMFFDMLKR